MTEKEPLSEMEQIRLRSVDPAFLRECDIAVKQSADARREVEYAVLLKQRGADEVKWWDKARVGFEAECAVEP